MRWDAAVLSHPDSDLSADDTSLLWGSCTLKCNRHRNPVISVAICLKYQQGVSCHPRIMCQIWSLKNITHILNTVHWTRSVFNCHSSDTLSLLHRIPFLISILIMGILSLMVWLCFMVFSNGWWNHLWNYSNLSWNQITCYSVANKGKVNGWDGRTKNISFWSSSTFMYTTAKKLNLQGSTLLVGREDGDTRIERKVKICWKYKFVTCTWGNLLWLSSISREELLVWGFEVKPLKQA